MPLFLRSVYSDTGILQENTQKSLSYELKFGCLDSDGKESIRFIYDLVETPKMFSKGGFCCIRRLSINLECCISFCLTSYKRCDRLLNREVVFTRRYYPICYNVIPYLLWLNVGKTKKANSGRKFPKLMAY